MTKPHRLKWFRDNIGKVIKRRDFTMLNKFVEIEVKDNWKAQQLFKTQFDLGLRYYSKKNDLPIHYDTKR
jgi:hypothetical protein